jgi:hypothetical protein
MVVSGFIFQGSSGFLFAGEEASKKRTFFPENIVNSDSLSHACLLSSFEVVKLALQDPSAS